MVYRNANESDEPMFVISVAARLVEMHPQTLRYYERAGLLKPTRSSGKIRLYSQREIDRLRKIARLTSELGVNLAGVEIIIDLTERLETLQEWTRKREMELLSEIEQLKQAEAHESSINPGVKKGRKAHDPEH